MTIYPGPGELAFDVCKWPKALVRMIHLNGSYVPDGLALNWWTPRIDANSDAKPCLQQTPQAECHSRAAWPFMLVR